MATTPDREHPILSAISEILISVDANNVLILVICAGERGFPCPRSMGYFASILDTIQYVTMAALP
jgi:hypothetical protein